MMKIFKEIIKLKIFWCRLHTLLPTDPQPTTGPMPYLRSHPEASTNYTNLTSNIFLTTYFTDLIISAPHLLVWLLSNDVIISLSSTSVRLVWKSAKCLTHRFILHRMQTFTCEIIFSPIYHQQSWKANPEPVIGFGQCGLTLFIHLAKTPPGCSASSSTLGAFVTKAFSNTAFLVKIYCFMYRFLFEYFLLFYIAFRS